MSKDLFIPEVSALQKFKAETISRTQIKNAEYNPRTISDERRAKLHESIERFGLVQAPVWNKRTGNLVGGHKRIEEIDSLSQSPEYSLTVNAIDVGEEEEKALNIILNSPEIGGEFDEDLLQKLLAELNGKLSFDLDALISGAKEKAGAKLRQLTAATPSKMAWVLVGIPLVRYAEIDQYVEAVGRVPETQVEVHLVRPLVR